MKKPQRALSSSKNSAHFKRQNHSRKLTRSCSARFGSSHVGLISERTIGLLEERSSKIGSGSKLARESYGMLGDSALVSILIFSLHRPLISFLYGNERLLEIQPTMGDLDLEIERLTAEAVLETSRLLTLVKKLPNRVEDLKVKHLQRLHSALLPKHRGRLRKHDLRIFNPHFVESTLHTVPPNLIESYLKDLCNYVARRDTDWFASANFLHAQLLQIHPFPDGNGRVSRLIALWYATKVGGDVVAMALTFVFQIISGRVLFFPALASLRQGNREAYFEYQEHCSRWVDAFSSRLLDSPAGQCNGIEDRKILRTFRHVLAEPQAALKLATGREDGVPPNRVGSIIL